MKRKIIFICAICIALITAAVIILYPKQNSEISYEVFKARADINSYFQAVINEDYDKAVKYVSFFNAEKGAELTTIETEQKNWIARISNLAKKNIKVSSIENLIVKTVNGTIYAQITLKINDVGYYDVVNYVLELDINDNAGLFDIKYKIKDVTDEDLRLEIEDALSGIVK